MGAGEREGVPGASRGFDRGFAERGLSLGALAFAVAWLYRGGEQRDPACVEEELKKFFREVGEVLPQSPLQGEAALALGDLLWEREEVLRAERWYRKALLLAQERGGRVQERLCRGRLAVVSGYQGDWARMEEALEQLLREEAVDTAPVSARYWCQMAELALWREEKGRVWLLVLRAWSLLRRAGGGSLLALRKLHLRLIIRYGPRRDWVWPAPSLPEEDSDDGELRFLKALLEDGQQEEALWADWERLEGRWRRFQGGVLLVHRFRQVRDWRRLRHWLGDLPAEVFPGWWFWELDWLGWLYFPHEMSEGSEGCRRVVRFFREKGRRICRELERRALGQLGLQEEMGTGAWPGWPPVLWQGWNKLWAGQGVVRAGALSLEDRTGIIWRRGALPKWPAGCSEGVVFLPSPPGKCSVRVRCTLAREGSSASLGMDAWVLLEGGSDARFDLQTFRNWVDQTGWQATVHNWIRGTERGMAVFPEGESQVMRSLEKRIRRVAQVPFSVLITGESGCGKERVARAIHRLSGQAQGPFVAVNGAAIPENLLEAELFGYRRGAFTGADRDRPGLIEEAQGGVLFLDEVGDLPLPMQAKLLRVLQERELRRLGDNHRRKVSFRLICATHRNLETLIAGNGFREDFYYRIRELQLRVPPLRERLDDLPALILTFLEQYGQNPAVLESAPELLGACLGYSWPGNVRELEVWVKEWVTFYPDTPGLPGGPEGIPLMGGGGRVQGRWRRARMLLERFLLHEALKRHGGSRTQAASWLGLGRVQVQRLLRVHEHREEDESWN